jgi:hypothetical protein
VVSCIFIVQTAFHFCLDTQEAKELSSLKPQLDEAGFQLNAVVHERLGVDEFRPYFDGEIFLDEEV